MPFQQMSKDEQRRKLAYRVLGEHVSVAQAAREMGVSRPTAYLWIGRAREEGIASLSERSRRPRRSPGATDPQIAASVLATKARYPPWGAKKIHALLWPSGAGPAPV